MFDTVLTKHWALKMDFVAYALFLYSYIFENPAKEIPMKKLIHVIFILIVVLIFPSTAFARNETTAIANTAAVTVVSNEDIKAYCDAYGIEYHNTTEFRNEVENMIQQRGSTTKVKVLKYKAMDCLNLHGSSKDPNSGKKSRDIPDSKIADIIWTNNPVTPWNHVGLYRKSTQIIEAIGKGVKTRNVGVQQEYPFKIYKVMKKDNSGRYSKNNRKAVAAWAYAQLGKPYDVDFSDNKRNNAGQNWSFNCSELVWKAWRFNGKVNPDLDSNGGLGVYPNNIKNSNRTVRIYTDNN